MKIPSAQAFKLYDFNFDDFSLDDEGSLKVRPSLYLIRCGVQDLSLQLLSIQDSSLYVLSFSIQNIVDMT